MYLLLKLKTWNFIVWCHTHMADSYLVMDYLVYILNMPVHLFLIYCNCPFFFKCHECQAFILYSSFQKKLGVGEGEGEMVWPSNNGNGGEGCFRLNCFQMCFKMDKVKWQLWVKGPGRLCSLDTSCRAAVFKVLFIAWKLLRVLADHHLLSLL